MTLVADYRKRPDATYAGVVWGWGDLTTKDPAIAYYSVCSHSHSSAPGRFGAQRCADATKFRIEASLIEADMEMHWSGPKGIPEPVPA